jgi:hypothetical protein
MTSAVNVTCVSLQIAHLPHRSICLLGLAPLGGTIALHFSKAALSHYCSTPADTSLSRSEAWVGQAQVTEHKAVYDIMSTPSLWVRHVLPEGKLERV